MLPLLASLAFAQQARVFESDQAAVDWVLLTRHTMRTRLPVVGPAPITEWAHLLGNADVQLVVVPPGVDPDAAALSARSRLGAPCALAFAAVDSEESSGRGGPWAGWVSGHCGLLFLGAWHYEPGGRVFDDRDRPIQVPHFAADAGDLDVLATYRKLDRVRGRAIWNTLLGTGLVYVGQIGLTAARNDNADTTGWWVTTGVGGALTAAGVIQFAWVQADKRSHPKNLLAHYTEAEIRERIEAHNKRLRLTGGRPHPSGPRLVSIGPFGIQGTF